MSQKSKAAKWPSNFDELFEVTSDVLSQSQFSVIKVGVDRKTKEKVAVKLMAKRLVDEVLSNVVEILSSNHHPNIVHFRGVFETDQVVFFVTDLLEGGDLEAELQKRKTFSEKDSAEITRQLCEALAFLHERGIVHRELNLQHLVRKKKDSLEINLVGLGVIMETLLQNSFGVPYYVSPDVLEGVGFGPETDMWSVGVIIYFLLSGRTPFFGDSPVQVFEAIFEGNLVWSSPHFDHVSDEAKDLMKKLVVVEPAGRLTAKQALEHPWLNARSLLLPGSLKKEGMSQPAVLRASRQKRKILSRSPPRSQDGGNGTSARKVVICLL